MTTKDENARSISALTAMARTVPGLAVQHLGGERISAEITVTAGQFDLDLLRQHQLIKQSGAERVPGVSGTVCFDECTDRVHLATYHPGDLVTLLNAAFCGVVVPEPV